MEEINAKTRLQTKITIKQLSRKNINIVYETFDKWKIERKKLAKKKKNTTFIDFKIDELSKELDRIEENME
jgi:hypothetical protein